MRGSYLLSQTIDYEMGTFLRDRAWLPIYLKAEMKTTKSKAMKYISYFGIRISSSR